MSTTFERVKTQEGLPFEIKKVFVNAGVPDEPIRAHVNLWREFVARMVMDSLGFTGQSEPDKHIKLVKEARHWFRYSKEDVSLTFDFADMPLEICREYILENNPLTKKIPRTTRESTNKKAKHGKNCKAIKPKGTRPSGRVLRHKKKVSRASGVPNAKARARTRGRAK